MLSGRQSLRSRATHRNWRKNIPLPSKTASTVCLALLPLTLAACGTATKSLQGYTPSTNLNGLVQDQREKPTLVYVRPGAPGLGKYNSFIIDPVRVNYQSGSIKGLDRSQVQKMRQKFRAQLIAELAASDYRIVTKPGRNTLRISMTIANLKAPSAITNVSNVVLPFSLAVGEVTIEGAFRQSSNNRVDAVVVNRAQGQRLMNAKPWSTWADAEQSFKEWAQGIRKAVDRAHGK